MIPKNIENSIVKYLNSEASIIEMEELETWLEDDKKVDVFKDYVKLNYLIDINTAKILISFCLFFSLFTPYPFYEAAKSV